jgi:hypothetical protein
MIWPGEIWRSIRGVTDFAVTEDHLKLLRRAHVSWDDSEYGAPAIDSKRPYGWSNIGGSMAQILDWPDRDWIDGDPPPGMEERCARLHAETAIALQIVLATGEFRAGRYTRQERGDSWTRWRADG